MVLYVAAGLLEDKGARKFSAYLPQVSGPTSMLKVYNWFLYGIMFNLCHTLKSFNIK